jgi:hypothetical protein
MPYANKWVSFSEQSSAPGNKTLAGRTSTPGNAVVVLVTQSSNVTPCAAGEVTDSQGNSYAFAGNLVDPYYIRQLGVYYAVNIVGGASHTITYALTPTATIIVSAVEISGVQAAAFDVSDSGIGQASGAVDSGGVATTVTDTLIGCAVAQPDTFGTWTAGTNYTSREEVIIGTISHSIIETWDAAPAATRAATATYSQASIGWAVWMIALKEGGGGGGLPLITQMISRRL